MIVNQALVRRGIPIPQNARCEDWWLALVGVAFGILEEQPETSLDWRRHGLNDSLMSSSLSASVLSAIKNASSHRRTLLASLAENRVVIQAFFDSFGNLVPKKERDTMQAFISLPTMGLLARRHAILKHRIFYSSWIRTVGLLILV